MRKRWSTILVGAITLLLTTWGVAPMKAAASPPASAVQSTATSAAAHMSLAASKVAQKKLCTRIYFEGKPAKPTVVKLWCNGGKTLIRIGTKGLVPGKAQDVNISKAGYHVWLVGYVKHKHRQSELRVYYTTSTCLNEVALRRLWVETPGQTRQECGD